MREITETLNTNGTGLWSEEVREVTVTALSLLEFSLHEVFGELRVKFDIATWDPEKHGLIYTDKGFLEELKDLLTRAQYDVSEIEYSEAGMQGDDYVSLDVGPKFIASWNATK